MFVAVVLLLACAPSARGQTYFCCLDLGTGWVQCGNGDWCQFTYCVGGYGQGIIYGEQTVYCCGNPYAGIIDNPLGVCYLGNAPTRTQAQMQIEKRIWVRDCKGRYGLLMLPVGGYPWSDARAKRGGMRRAPRRG